MSVSLSEAQLQSARELVDDLELARLSPEHTLLRALRMARLVEDEVAQEWLRYELSGYPDTPRSRPWMRHFGRFTDEANNLGYWIPLAGVAGTIASMQTQVQTLRVPDIHFAPSSANPHEWVVGGVWGTTAQVMLQPAQTVLLRLENLTNAISSLSSIRSRVLAAIHEFAVSAYHRLAFSGLAESIFEEHRRAVDVLLSTIAPEALEKLSAVYDRLSAGDAEAVSHAMNSLRRIIKALADQVYPASDQPVTVDGQRYEVGSDRVLDRIRLYLMERCQSKSRRERLNRTLRDIHERASVGSHTDISANEARSLFLGAYLAVGEILEFTEYPRDWNPPGEGVGL